MASRYSTRSNRFIVGGTGNYKFSEEVSTKLTVGYDLDAGQAEVYFAPAVPGQEACYTALYEALRDFEMSVAVE